MATGGDETHFLNKVCNTFGKTIAEHIRPETDIIKKRDLHQLGEVYIHPSVQPIYKALVKKELTVGHWVVILGLVLKCKCIPGHKLHLVYKAVFESLCGKIFNIKSFDQLLPIEEREFWQKSFAIDAEQKEGYNQDCEFLAEQLVQFSKEINIEAPNIKNNTFTTNIEEQLRQLHQLKRGSIYPHLSQEFEVVDRVRDTLAPREDIDLYNDFIDQPIRTGGNNLYSESDRLEPQLPARLLAPSDNFIPPQANERPDAETTSLNGELSLNSQTQLKKLLQPRPHNTSIASSASISSNFDAESHKSSANLTSGSLSESSVDGFDREDTFASYTPSYTPITIRKVAKTKSNSAGTSTPKLAVPTVSRASLKPIANTVSTQIDSSERINDVNNKSSTVISSGFTHQNNCDTLDSRENPTKMSYVRITDFLPTKFNPSSKESDPEGHILGFRDYLCAQLGVTTLDDLEIPSEKLDLFKYTLLSSARIWFENLKPFYSIGDLEQKFLKQFAPDLNSRTSAARALSELKYDKNTKLCDFVNKIQRLNRVLGYSDQVLKDRFLAAMPADIRRLIGISKPRNLKETIELASKILEDETHDTGSYAVQETDDISGTVVDMAMSIQTLKGEINKIAERMSTERSDGQRGRGSNRSQGRGFRRGNPRGNRGSWNRGTWNRGNYRGRYVPQNSFRGYNRGQRYMGPPGRGPVGVRCFGCGNFGHLIRECPNNYHYDGAACSYQCEPQQQGNCTPGQNFQ